VSGSAYVIGDIKGDYLINEVAGTPVLMKEHPECWVNRCINSYTLNQV
jgi:hypothetical protein